MMRTFLVLTIGGMLATSSLMAQNYRALPNPTAAQVANARATGYCDDPWVTMAIWYVQAGTRNPNGVKGFGECNTQLYNGGTWSSYGELVQAVQATTDALRAGKVWISLADNGNNTLSVAITASGALESYIVAGRIVNQNGQYKVVHFAGNSASGVASPGAGDVPRRDGLMTIGQDVANYEGKQKGARAKVPLPGGRAMFLGK